MRKCMLKKVCCRLRHPLRVWLIGLSADKANRERIEARNDLETYAFGLKNQVNDDDGLGSRIDQGDKEHVLDAVKETLGWLQEHGAKASTEDFREQKENLSGAVYPITSKLYSSGGHDDVHGEEDWSHSEL
jgi:endoplasmic reticulum chaperone BiP